MTTTALLVYLLVGSAAGFSLPSRRSPSSSPRTTRTRLFLRNIDRPELIIFGCERAFAEDDDEEDEGAAQTPAPHPGVVALSQDALAAGAVVAICSDRRTSAQLGEFVTAALASSDAPALAPRIDAFGLDDAAARAGAPTPASVTALRERMLVQPELYGGGAGYLTGRGSAEAAREPLAARTVLVEAWGRRRGCLAGRAAGMRVIVASPWAGSAADDAADVDDVCDVAFDEGLADVSFDDLYTPGSYWLNPPSPRDAAGNWADPRGNGEGLDAAVAIDDDGLAATDTALGAAAAEAIARAPGAAGSDSDRGGAADSADEPTTSAGGQRAGVGRDGVGLTAAERAILADLDSF